MKIIIIINITALVLLLITAVPFFIAVNLSPYSSGWTDMASLIGFGFTAYGILTVKGQIHRLAREKVTR